MALTLFTPPTAEPVSLEEAKRHLRVDGNDEDVDILGLITAAREQAERHTRRQLLTATWDLKLDRFPADVIRVPRPPLQSVVSITYTDGHGQAQVMDPADYQVDADSEPGRIVPAYGTTWPTTREELNAVVVRYTAGYATPAAVPAKVKQGMKLLLAHWYEHREAVLIGVTARELPAGVRSLFWAEAVPEFA